VGKHGQLFNVKDFFEGWQRGQGGTPTVADPVFFLFRQFRHGQATIWQQENRVVPETVFTTFLRDDFTITIAFKGVVFSARDRHNRGTVKMRVPWWGIALQLVP
jgi:hypothetical protein